MRKVKVWNACEAQVIDTHMTLEHVLTQYNRLLPRGYIAIVFNTTAYDDITLLQQECCSNLFLVGDTEQLLLDCVVDGIEQRGDHWWFTVYAEHMAGEPSWVQ